MLNDKETSYMSFSCLNNLHLHADGLRHLVHEMHRTYTYVQGKNLTFDLNQNIYTCILLSENTMSSSE